MRRRAKQNDSGRTILVVDDQEDVRVSTQALLTREGHRVLTASSAEQAVQLLREREVDLLLVDYFMPGTTGEQLVGQVRSFDPFVQIILQTGYSGEKPPREILAQLDIQGYHDKAEGPEKLLLWVDVGLKAQQRLQDVRAHDQRHSRAGQTLRGLVLAKLCHDLRSCLHVIHGYTELLSGDPAAAPLQPVLSRLAAASDTARELVQQYLDLAHLDSPGVVVRRELVDVDNLLEELTAHAEHQIGTKALRFTRTVPVRGAVIHSDREKLTVILKQLLNNAITFSVAGSIELALGFAADQTHFVLTDSGPAMGRAEFARLAFAGQPGPAAPRAATPGLGLGLAIAVRLSELLGGALRADRGAKGGAIFTLSLPAPALAAASDVPTLH